MQVIKSEREKDMNGDCFVVWRCVLFFWRSVMGRWCALEKQHDDAFMKQAKMFCSVLNNLSQTQLLLNKHFNNQLDFRFCNRVRRFRWIYLQTAVDCSALHKIFHSFWKQKINKFQMFIALFDFCFGSWKSSTLKHNSSVSNSVLASDNYPVFIFVSLVTRYHFE